MTDEFGKDRFQDVKASDALGRLASRSRGSRTMYVLVAIVILFAFAFVLGLIINSVRGNTNTPSVPQVNLR